jgi:DNA repair exonuclease SbcCD ATPase subunit
MFIDSRKSLLQRLGSFLMVATIVPVGLYCVADRRVGDLLRLVRASADVTVDGLEGEIPQEIHDRRRQHELASLRQDLLDRQVQLTRSKSRVAEIQKEIDRLVASVERRQRLLAEATPLLERATEQQLETVVFAQQTLPLAAFQQELDQLLAQQQHEEQQLELQRQGIARLKQTEEQAEGAIQQLQHTLTQAEQEVELLVARRAQAEVEQQTLDMAQALTQPHRPGEEALAGSVARLRDEVQALETRNQARRANAPAGSVASSNRLARQWDRLEALRALRDRLPAGQAATGSESLVTAQSTGELTRQPAGE